MKKDNAYLNSVFLCYSKKKNVREWQFISGDHERHSINLELHFSSKKCKLVHCNKLKVLRHEIELIVYVPKNAL